MVKIVPGVPIHTKSRRNPIVSLLGVENDCVAITLPGTNQNWKFLHIRNRQ